LVSSNAADDPTLPHRVLAFYAIAPQSDPDMAVERHRAFLSQRGMVGRVYVSAEGLNAQVSGTTAHTAEYRAFIEAELADAGVPLIFKVNPIEELAFPKLRVKHKSLVPVAPDEAAPDLTRRGEDVSPEQWAAMLADRTTPKHVLDVRNAYEWDVGHFEGAARPAGTNFADFDSSSFKLPTDAASKAETPIMMYCTGGVRCEYFSARLRAEGFQKVYKLQGGVQAYGNAMADARAEATTASDAPATTARDAPAPTASDAPATTDTSPKGAARGEAGGEAGGEARGEAGGAVPHWRGSLFVFDRRNLVRFGDAASAREVLGRCAHCGAPTESFVNCGNIDCNALHLVCASCLPRRRGFCSTACEVAPRRRPLDLLAGPDGTVDWEAAVTTTQGPRPGETDPNALSSWKVPNVPRKDFDADRGHLRVPGKQ
jgi:UPF0176 protein